MKFVLFCHSFVSCWNHGNAHFLRGVARELLVAGHQVAVFEPLDGWSRRHALGEPNGARALREAARLVPGVELHTYNTATVDLEQAVSGADVVIVHEWTDPGIVARLGRLRAGAAPFALFFHDTHHRAITAAHEIGTLDLDGYDAVLAFGESLSDAYRALGWGGHVMTWHEAADVALFHPVKSCPQDRDLIWIGNWGDEERSAALRRFLIEPAARLRLSADVYGVRYPQPAHDALTAAGIRFLGWLPNHRVPQTFGRARATVHIPREAYTTALRGIPTIRMFEALACGIPLVCSPWDDEENLFPAGSYLSARNTAEMASALRAAIADRDLASELSQRGIAAIRSRHTCAHRVNELLRFHERLHRSRRHVASLESAKTEAI